MFLTSKTSSVLFLRGFCLVVCFCFAVSCLACRNRLAALFGYLRGPPGNLPSCFGELLRGFLKLRDRVIELVVVNRIQRIRNPVLRSLYSFAKPVDGIVDAGRNLIHLSGSILQAAD